MSLEAGEKAPQFKGKNEHGEEISLSDFKGRKVVLYFYPKDNTPGCTAQACSLRDNYEELLLSGYVVLGVSPDSEKSHQKFIKKFSLPFPLIADTDHKIAEAYGVWAEKSMFGKKYMGVVRTTFIIDENGKIEEVISKVDTAEHAGQILK